MQGQQVYLVDTPGLGDSKRSIAKLAEKSVVTSPAYVYVMSYNNLEDEKDSNAFQRMYEKDEGRCTFYLYGIHASVQDSTATA